MVPSSTLMSILRALPRLLRRLGSDGNTLQALTGRCPLPYLVFINDKIILMIRGFWPCFNDPVSNWVLVPKNAGSVNLVASTGTVVIVRLPSSDGLLHNPDALLPEGLRGETSVIVSRTFKLPLRVELPLFVLSHIVHGQM